VEHDAGRHEHDPTAGQAVQGAEAEVGEDQARRSGDAAGDPLLGGQQQWPDAQTGRHDEPHQRHGQHQQWDGSSQRQAALGSV